MHPKGIDYSAINSLDRYSAAEMAYTLRQRIKALRMADMARRIESGELALGATVRIYDNLGGQGRIVGYRGLRVLVDTTAAANMSVDFDRVGS